MDKKGAIEFLKKSLDEIPHLENLPYSNDKFPLWHKTIEGVLEGVFGKNSSEYENFYKAQSYVSYLGEDYQKTYLAVLKRRETAIRSIIRTHELLGVETKPTAMAELLEAAKNYKVWQWIKSHKPFSIIITTIMLIAAIITIVGFAKGFFS